MLTAKSLIRMSLRDLKYDQRKALMAAESYKRDYDNRNRMGDLYNESAWKNEARLIARFREELGHIYRLIHLGYAT